MALWPIEHTVRSKMCPCTLMIGDGGGITILLEDEYQAE